ncbi:MAG: hypothetical protein H0T62_05315 [Parachlamydiaceae bacterium]|nr:hypothetical protein [Parachlamydiaceae bacterium]
MGFATDAVKNLMFEIVPVSNVLPEVLWNGFSVIHNVQRSWILYRQAEKYSDPANYFNILQDQGVGIIIRNNDALKFGAQCLMILRCVSECVDGYKEVCRVYQNFLDVIHNQYPRLDEEPWHKEVEFNWISPPELHRLKSTLKNNIQYIQRIAKCLFKLVEKFFILSLLMLEAADAFSLSPEKVEEASVEVISNVKKLTNQFADNTEFLLEKLKQDRSIIENLLSMCPINQTEEENQNTIDAVIESIETIVRKTKVINKEIKEIDNEATELIIRVGKDILFSAATIFGCTELLPDSLIPPSPSSTPKKLTYARFIPDRLITRLDAPQKKQVKPPKKRDRPPENLSAQQVKTLFKVM